MTTGDLSQALALLPGTDRAVLLQAYGAAFGTLLCVLAGVTVATALVVFVFLRGEAPAQADAAVLQSPACRGRRRRAGSASRKTRRSSCPIAVMENQPDVLEERVTELEIKSSYAEDLLDQLNMTIYRQQEQIDRLIRQVAQLREQSQNAMPDASGGNARDELPPHY